MGQIGITKWGKFWDYKVGQDGLQSGAAIWITKWGKKITKWGRDYKVGQGLQIGAIQPPVDRLLDRLISIMPLFWEFSRVNE